MPWTPNGLPDELVRTIDSGGVLAGQPVGGETASMNKEAAVFERASRPNWQYH
jgi:hypothetical protein